jgi:hypothetical protein
MPGDFNIPLSMPSWNEQVTARPQHGLLSQQAELRKRKMLQLQAELAAAAATPPSFAYEQLSDGIPPVENFAPPPAQNLIQQPQHIGGSTTGLIGGPPPIDARMTLTKRFPQQVGADSYEHRMGVTPQPGLLVDQTHNAGLVGRPQPMPQPTLSGQQPGSVPGLGNQVSGADAIDTLLPLMSTLEGTTQGLDHLGNQTEALGLVNDPVNQPTATTRNNAVAREMFARPLDQLTLQEKGDVVYAIFQDLDAELEDYKDPTTKEKTYNYLSPKYKALVLDAKFNTGTTYKKLMKAALRHQDNPSAENLAAMTQESRRKVTENGVKVNHFGMDNRVRNLFRGVGLEADPNQLISRNPGSDVNVQPTATPANWYEDSQLSDYQFSNLGMPPSSSTNKTP